MVMKMIRRFLREPLPSLAVVILGAILSLVLCNLEQSQLEELESFQKTYSSVPVHFSIADLDGGQPSSSEGIPGWIVDLFYPEGKLDPDFCSLTTDRQLRMEHDAIVGISLKIKNGPLDRKRIIGITSTQVARELTPEYSGDIIWYEGFDESILQTQEPVLIVPDDYDGEDQVLLTFRHTENQEQVHTYSQTFTVVGRFSDQGNHSFYCPYKVMEYVFKEIKESRKIQCFAATLTDNSRLEELHETAAHWFAEPNPLGEETYWGKYGYTNYLYALDIRDDLLETLEENLETSMSVNRLSALAVLVLSATTGFLTGFLMVRSRKREIALMRTLGCSEMGVYFEFALEQLLCISVGSVSASAVHQWAALNKAGMLIGFYVMGLSMALLIFMRNNLLINLKEDE